MLKFNVLFVCLLTVFITTAQELTVEKIMRDPKWIGTQPSDPVWSPDSKWIYFKWNPEKNMADSNYRYSLATKKIEKALYYDAARIRAMQAGKYNSNYTQLVYEYDGDLYLFDTKTNSHRRLTITEEKEGDPVFIENDSRIAFTSGGNLFAWDIARGHTAQLTNFSRTAPTGNATNAAANRTGNRATTALSSGANTPRVNTVSVNEQEKWLEQNQLNTSEVLKQRKEKEDARKAFLKNIKEDDSLFVIRTGDRTVQNLQISPNGKYITYRLYTAPASSKRIIVPDYVTESGFTTDISGRAKVGNTLGKTEFFVYDRSRDTVILVETDSMPGLNEMPDYQEDYPSKFKDKKTTRGVTVYGPYWNDAGTKAFVDIRSQDYKDRWLMLLDAVNGQLELIDRQRDEAWIAGPGISSGNDAEAGWISNDVLYYQSEGAGYSHLYSYNVNSGKKNQLTSGKYEVQDLELSRDKKHFYLLTNEEHPGKQNWYAINTDGTQKQKLTNMTGGYEVKISPDEKHIAYRYSYMNKPWELYVQENTPGKKAVQITDKSMSDTFRAYAWREPQIVEIPARDGATIYARLYEPDPSKKNGAAVIFVHGAGYLQNVHYWWSSYYREYMFHNLLTDLGYTVIDADYRASSGYGRDWRTGIYRFMGGKDLDDNLDAVQYLVKNKGIDPKKVGMYGGSYGGFITLMTLFTRPGAITAGAALRPVTDWAHYNHEYTARILNEPFNDSIAYARSSPINFASGLQDHLLICHGMIDVNVNFQDVVRLTQRLIELGKDNWEVAIYPLEDHGFVEPSSWTDEYKRILKLFDTTLLGKKVTAER